MLLEELRKQTIETGLRLLNHRLVSLTMGNMSARDPQSGYVVIKPAGIEYPDIDPGDMVVLDLDGSVVDGRLKPSTEWPMHLAVYRERNDINAVIHTHSPYATSFAVVGRDIPVLNGEFAALGGAIQVARYAPGGTHELGLAALEALGDRDAVLLRNHGVLAVGPTLKRAFYAAVMVEEGARLFILGSVIGTPLAMENEFVRAVREEYLHHYFQR